MFFFETKRKWGPAHDCEPKLQRLGIIPTFETHTPPGPLESASRNGWHEPHTRFPASKNDSQGKTGPRDLGRKIHLKSQPQEGQKAGTKTKLGVPTWPVTQSGIWDDTFHVEYFVFFLGGGEGNWRVIISINLRLGNLFSIKCSSDCCCSCCSQVTTS